MDSGDCQICYTCSQSLQNHISVKQEEKKAITNQRTTISSLDNLIFDRAETHLLLL